MARILVVDDDPGMRTMLEETLSAAGHSVQLTADGKQAIRELREKPAELVITDIFMPEMDGVEIMLELRKAFPKLAVIAISGNPSGMNLLSVARTLGAVTTLEKPFSSADLLGAVHQALKQLP